MINVVSKRCIYENCLTLPSYNIASETKPLYCAEHKKENMINVKNKYCIENNCKNEKIYGIINKPLYCFDHKKENMINLIVENKCNIKDCQNEHKYILNDLKYCEECLPNNISIQIKRMCKYCDLQENATYICNECIHTQNKKEWSIIRYLRQNIDTTFDHNKIIGNCSKKRPDAYFELLTHCVIVEIDENQHNSYDDKCECARINEIVNSIGGKSVILIRYNPDQIKNKNKIIKIKQEEKLELLINTVKEELIKNYDEFIVKIIQLYYNDNNNIYECIKEEDITNLVCI